MPCEDRHVLDWLRRIFTTDTPQRPVPTPEPQGVNVCHDAELITI
jgi:hypothetical protein